VKVDGATGNVLSWREVESDQLCSEQGNRTPEPVISGIAEFEFVNTPNAKSSIAGPANAYLDYRHRPVKKLNAFSVTGSTARFQRHFPRTHAINPEPAAK
jgi:hypothetical protein